MVLKSIILSLVLIFSLPDEPSTLYSTTKKRADKILNKYWQDQEHNISRVSLSGNNQPELYSVEQGNSKPYAYLLFAEANSKVDTFIYLIIFKPDGEIEKVSVLLYKENYGGEIASSRFLKQFEGKANGIDMKYNQDIDGISGATISVQSIILAVKEKSLAFNNLIQQIK